MLRAREQDVQGLLKRVKDLEKKNLVRVVLTEKGRETFANVSKRECIHRIMAALPTEMRPQFIESLTKILEASLKYLGETHEMPFPY